MGNENVRYLNRNFKGVQLKFNFLCLPIVKSCIASLPDFITFLALSNSTIVNQLFSFSELVAQGGARIKSESAEVKKWIFEQEKKNEGYCEYKRSDGERLILSYSDARAGKDAYNRERGAARLGNAYKSGKLTKQQVNKRGYNKFFEISKDVQVVINQEKIAEDSKWDGLKGYITNTALDAARTITAIRVNMPENRKVYTKTLFLTERHQVIKLLFETAEPGESFGWRIDEVRSG